MKRRFRKRLFALLALAGLALSADRLVAQTMPPQPNGLRPLTYPTPRPTTQVGAVNTPAISSGTQAPVIQLPPTSPGGGTMSPPTPGGPQATPAQFQSIPTAAPVQDSPGFFDGIFSGPVTSRLYARTDFLLWWLKGAPLSVPLVSTGPIPTTHHGFLTSPDAIILYGAKLSPATGGQDRQDFPLFKGGRATLGMWLDDEQRFGIEVSGLMLQRRVAGYEIRSGPDGNPIICVPVYNTIAYAPGGVSMANMAFPQGEDGLPASLPDDERRARANGILTGGVKITNSIQLWGMDITGSATYYRDSAWEFSGLAGIRYLDLSEKFDLHWDSTGQSGAYVGQSGVVEETFQTRNHFYGGILGMRGRYSYGRLSVDMMARMSTGVSHEVLNVWGYYLARGFPPPSSTGPEGIFAQPANEGRRSANKFAVVPELQLKVGYAVTPRLHLSLGYDYLYYSSVLRPTDQISRDIPKGQTFNQGNVPSTTQSPRQLFVPTDFFAHGMTFGLDFRY